MAIQEKQEQVNKTLHLFDLKREIACYNSNRCCNKIYGGHEVIESCAQFKQNSSDVVKTEFSSFEPFED